MATMRSEEDRARRAIADERPQAETTLPSVTTDPVSAPATSVSHSGQLQPTTEPHSFEECTAPELGVRATAALVLYFEQEYGLKRLEDLWQREKIPVPRKYLKTPTNFISLRFFERLCNMFVQESGDPRFMRNAGLYTASREALGSVYYILKALGSPRLCYEKVIENGPVYNRVGTFSIQRIDNRELVFNYKSRAAEQNRNICELRMGQFASFPSIWRLPPAEIREIQCQVMGAEFCRYQVKWQNPVRVWRQVAGVLLGASCGIALSTLASAPLTLSVVLCAITGGAIGAWFHAREVLRLKDDSMAIQNKALSENMVELLHRYEEAHKMNLELEKRVCDRTAQLSAVNHELRVSLERQMVMQEELLQKAITDELTGLFTRRFLTESLNAEIQRVARASGHLSCLLLDVDKFKQINDTFGHSEGDRVLRQIGSVLHQTVRKSDLLSRFGGEEFFALLRSTDIVGGEKSAEKIRQAIERSVRVNNSPVTVSIGVSCLEVTNPGSHVDAEALAASLIEIADKAMYASKERGRNQVTAGKTLRFQNPISHSN